MNDNDSLLMMMAAIIFVSDRVNTTDEAIKHAVAIRNSVRSDLSRLESEVFEGQK